MLQIYCKARDALTPAEKKLAPRSNGRQQRPKGVNDVIILKYCVTLWESSACNFVSLLRW